MPGTTRYSATFDRTYDEDESSSPEPTMARRSRSQSMQVESLSDRKHFYSSAQGSHSRSSSTEKPPKGAELIPTRTVGKPTVKPHNNPFQFVAVGNCSLYKKAEEQLKKVKEIKKPAVIKEDEEEWQSNLDSWKSRRRKMSEGTFKRQEELRKLEMEDVMRNNQSQQQKKIKTFTEIVEERAHRGRALSLCLFSNPLESNEWIFENPRSRRISHDPLHASEESAESSNINSEDDNDSYRKSAGLNGSLENKNGRNEDDGPEHHPNGVQTSTSNSSISKNSDLSEFDVSQESILNKDQSSGSMYGDSGLESLSSSHRAGDVPDSGSDFSQDSGSSIGCDSPRVSGLIPSSVDFMEEFSSPDEFVKKSGVTHKEKSPVRATNGIDANGKSNTSSKATPVKQVKQSTSSAEKKQTKEKAKKVKSSSVKKNSSQNSQSPKTDNSVDVCSSPESGINLLAADSGKSTESENEASVEDFDKLARLKTEESFKKAESEMQFEHSSSSSASQAAKNSEHSATKDGVNLESQSNENSSSSSKKSGTSCDFSLIEEVPVDKVAEEMERLILQQLEEEERMKEIGANVKAAVELETPSKHVSPPKEKPPPPPVVEVPATKHPSSSTKTSSVKRVNSTKRILKEIHRRRSDFLGIEEPKGAITSHDELSVQPPPALEDLLKAEQEESRKLKNSLKSVPSNDQEDDIARKEREIIENLETEERMKMGQSENCANNGQELNTAPSLQADEEERIKRLKEELKRNEEERLLAEEQRLRLEEAKLLQQREQQLREQEAKEDSQAKTSAPSAELPSTNKNNVSEPVANDEKVTLLANGDGSDALLSSSSCSAATSTPAPLAELKKSEKATQPSAAVVPRPLKKKEAIRRERERLRREQEVLQREREEHRRKVQMEQEQLKKNLQKAHVPGTPVCQVDSPPAVASKPSLPPQLTPSLHTSHMHREARGQVNPVKAQNGFGEAAPVAGLYPQPKPKSSSQPKQNIGSSARSRSGSSDSRVKQKVPLVKKQPEQSNESRYNQNHWLIQEAEMRRITEQKERQHNQFHGETRHNNPSYMPSAYPNAAKPVHRPSALPLAQNTTIYAVPMQYSPDKAWSHMQPVHHGAQNRKCVPQGTQPVNFDPSQAHVVYSSNFDANKPPPAKPSRSVPPEKQEQMLSVSGRKRCSHCGEELGRGAAMIIESLQLYYHIQCFQCCVCHAQLGNGSCGTDVRVRSNKLHCHNCYSNDEAGLKFSQV